MYKYTHTYIYVFICTYIYIYIYVYMHTGCPKNVCTFQIFVTKCLLKIISVSKCNTIYRFTNFIVLSKPIFKLTSILVQAPLTT